MTDRLTACRCWRCRNSGEMHCCAASGCDESRSSLAWQQAARVTLREWRQASGCWSRCSRRLRRCSRSGASAASRTWTRCAGCASAFQQASAEAVIGCGSGSKHMCTCVSRHASLIYFLSCCEPWGSMHADDEAPCQAAVAAGAVPLLVKALQPARCGYALDLSAKCSLPAFQLLYSNAGSWCTQPVCLTPAAQPTTRPWQPSQHWRQRGH